MAENQDDNTTCFSSAKKRLLKIVEKIKRFIKLKKMQDIMNQYSFLDTKGLSAKSSDTVRQLLKPTGISTSENDSKDKGKSRNSTEGTLGFLNTNNSVSQTGSVQEKCFESGIKYGFSQKQEHKNPCTLFNIHNIYEHADDVNSLEDMGMAMTNCTSQDFEDNTPTRLIDISTLKTLMQSTDEAKTFDDLLSFLNGEDDRNMFIRVPDYLIDLGGIYPTILILSLEAYAAIFKTYGDSSKLDDLRRIKNAIAVNFRISLVETKMFEDAMRSYLIATCKLTSSNIFPKYCRMFISLPIIKGSLLYQLDEKDRGH